jgi:hypothetical protein
MQYYRVTAPHFVAALAVETDRVLQSAPILSWSVGQQFEVVRDYCKQKGWEIEPLLNDSKPQLIEADGRIYRLHWNGGVLTRITVIDRSTETTHDVRYRDLPEKIKSIM